MSDWQINSYDDQRKVIETADGRHLLVSNAQAELIAILTDYPSLKEANKRFNALFNCGLSYDQFSALIEQKIKPLGLNLGSKVFIEKDKSYLWWKFQLLSPKVAGILASPFVFLFRPKLFKVLFGSLIIAVVLLLLAHSMERPGQWGLFFALVYASVLFHELGHIAACKQARVSHGEIGIALYRVFPVFYADVTPIWLAKKEQRVITNLAGLTMEFIYAACLYLAYVSSKSTVFLIASMTVSLKAAFQLNPFIRSDGYWVLSDALNLPNLLKRAKKESTALFRNPIAYSQQASKTALLLAAYSIVNTGLIGIYVCSMAIISHKDIIVFPAQLYQLIESLFIGQEFSGQESTPSFFAAIFYLITGLLIYKLLGRIFPKRANGRSFPA